jgi:predicted phage terminase large subunit-like protein
MDDINWRALYMQQPLDREGRLYDPDELRRYFELPDGQPDMIISVCDTKDRGSDDACMPVAYVYGGNYYIEDILCDNSKPEVVDELLIQMLLKHKVQLSCFESNAAGGRVAQTVQAGVKARGGITKIETRYTTQNKETKILANSPWVKEHCLFKDDTVIGNDKEYRRAMGFICSYTMSGKNKYDDVVDSLAQLSEYCQSFTKTKVSVFERPF